jgi:hypothetical protein
VWTQAGDTLDSARSGAQPLDLQEFHFSFIGDKVGMTRVYAELKEKLVRLLGQGSAQLHGLGKALTTAANEYEQEDLNSYHSLHHLY